MTIDIAGLNQRVGGDKYLLKKILTAYCEDMPKKLSSLKQALDDGGAETIIMRADNIAGASVNVMARQIAKASSDLMEAVKLGDIEKAYVMLARMETGYKRLLKILDDPFEL